MKASRLLFLAGIAVLVSTFRLGGQSSDPRIQNDSSAPLTVQKVDIDAAKGLETMPAGLSWLQLKGNLVAPPLRVFPDRYAFATDDRRITLSGPGGRLLWSVEMPRQIRPPLYAIGNFMILVTTSGDNVVCVRIDGTVLWEKRLPGLVDSWLLANPEGRLVQVFKNGTVSLMNPDASGLFTFSLGKTVSGPPSISAQGVRIPVSEGRVQYVSPDGAVSEPQVLVTETDPKTLSFSATKQQNSYTVRFTSPAADLALSSAGSFTHWSADNRVPRAAAWGDSKWRVFVFLENEFSSAVHGAPPNRSIPASENYRPSFTAINTQQELELRYVRQLLANARNDTELRAYLKTAVKPERLAGKLLFYEDLCIEILSSNTAQERLPVLRAETWDVLATFPSFARGQELASLMSSERDGAVLAAALAYLVRRGNDSDESFKNVISGSLFIWRALPTYASFKQPLAEAVRAIAPSWPSGEGAQSMIAEILLR